ncbi:MAG: glycosyltransferase family 4 protein [Methylobacterium sp.]|uniref:glycosyltransferase family 4 protein n=1 Tax=Methylobacterium sp. TaxID=409 RepID=UPI0025D1FBB4|nr:glycosyltransferase family 4 protein [Methylobacterium sp.]MBX9932024.1 glycosyltransferase family 4 protein [Methylobacterium sp.]
MTDLHSPGTGRLRILHLANHCHEIGNGIMNVAVDLACAQAEQGHTVSFASGGGSYVPLIESAGVRHHRLDQHWRRPLAVPGALLRLRALLKRERPDIVHAHMMTGAVLARMLRPGAKWRLVTTVHNEWQRSAVVMGVGDKVIAVSDAVARQMAKRGIASSRIEVVRNGPLGSPRRRYDGARAIDLGSPSILTVAGLYARKGIADLIAAFAIVAARHPLASLTIVGDGPDRTAFEVQARASGYSERIRFAGFAPDPMPYFRGTDIFVLASHSEPFGLVLAEAREAGCACIGCTVGGIPEVLEEGHAGLLTPPYDPPALARTLLALIEDPVSLAHWRRAARQNLDWLSTRRMAADTVAVYRHAMGAAGQDRHARNGPDRAGAASPVPAMVERRRSNPSADPAIR